MPEWTAISKINHQHSLWTPKKVFKFAAGSAVIPINISELGKLIAQYVITFVRDGERFQAVALVGLENQRNLYVNDEGEWLSPYIPESIRHFPFRLSPTEEQNKILTIATDHLEQETSTEPLFKMTGELAEKVGQVLAELNRSDGYTMQTDVACDLLASYGLIVPWPLKIQQADNLGTREINGLHCIDEQKMLDMASNDFAELRSNAALALAYAQMFSMSQLEQLSLRSEYNETRARKKSALDIGPLFSEESALNFDLIS